MSELFEVLAEKLCGFNKLDNFRNLPKDIVEKINETKPNNLRDNNKFLGENDQVKFWVFDIPRMITCPGATTKCKEHCYQIGVGNMHKGDNKDSIIVVHQKINLYRSLQDNFVDKTVKEIINKRPNERNVYIRIHACGDFYGTEYLKKWIEIATKVKETRPDYYFMAYTKSYTILDAVMQEKVSINPGYSLNDTNIHFMASVMDDTSDGDMKIIEKYQLPKYFATSNEVTSNKLIDCNSVVCARCMKCYSFPKGEIVTRLR